MDQPGVHPHAGIHSDEQAAGVSEADVSGDVVDMPRNIRAQATNFGPMLRHVGRRPTEHDLAGSVPHHVIDHLGPATRRPMLLRRRRPHGYEHPPASGGQPGENAGDPRRGLRSDPILVVAVIDRQALGSQEVEIAGCLMPSR